MEFQDVFDHVQENVEPNSVVVVMNLDIFIEKIINRFGIFVSIGVCDFINNQIQIGHNVE